MIYLLSNRKEKKLIDFFDQIHKFDKETQKEDTILNQLDIKLIHYSLLLD